MHPSPLPRAGVAARGVACAVLAGLAAVAAAQDPIDLLERAAIVSPMIALYGAKPQAPTIQLLRSDADASAFAIAAFGEDKKELHVDFQGEQVVALCWGARLVDGAFRGGVPDLRLDRAVVDSSVLGGTLLQITARTCLPLGRCGEPTDPAGTRLWFPSVFLRAPLTDRVLIDVVGARCKDRAADFRPIATRELEVRVAPDSMPSRADADLAEVQRATVTIKTDPIAQLDLNADWVPEFVESDDPASVQVVDQGNRKRLIIDWGTHRPAAYDLDILDLVVLRGVARIAVRARTFMPMWYSGPPAVRPVLGIDLPAVERVQLRIEQVGSLPKGDAHDFAPVTGKGLEVTVERAPADVH